MNNQLTTIMFFIFGLFLGGLLVDITDRDNACVIDRQNGKIVVWKDKAYALISVKSASDRRKELNNFMNYYCESKINDNDVYWELAVSSK